MVDIKFMKIIRSERKPSLLRFAEGRHNFCNLIYSYPQSDLSLVGMKPEKYTPLGYSVIATQIDQRDGTEFIRRLQNKYVKGRKRGRFPTTDIVKLELELFMKILRNERKRACSNLPSDDRIYAN